VPWAMQSAIIIVSQVLNAFAPLQITNLDCSQTIPATISTCGGSSLAAMSAPSSTSDSHGFLPSAGPPP
jgi:hypothetical protein